MPKRDDDLLIEDIIDNCRAVFDFVDGISYDDFVGDKMRTYAVIRAFEIIGEASKFVSDDLKTQHPLIEWRDMGDFRNHLIHHYLALTTKRFGTSPKTICLTIMNF